MEVTRNVILDLLPLYVDGEVSAETRALVEAYLETDPELEKIAQRLKKATLLDDIPVPLTKENEMEAYKEAKRMMLFRTVVIAIAITFVSLCTLVFFGAFGWRLSVSFSRHFIYKIPSFPEIQQHRAPQNFFIDAHRIFSHSLCTSVLSSCVTQCKASCAIFGSFDL